MLPESVTYINSYAFEGNVHTTNIPSKVTSVHSRAFYYCDYIYNVIVDSPDIAKIIYSYTSAGYLFYETTTVNILDSIQEIGSYITDPYNFVYAGIVQMNNKSYKEFSAPLTVDFETYPGEYVKSVTLPKNGYIDEAPVTTREYFEVESWYLDE